MSTLFGLFEAIRFLTIIPIPFLPMMDEKSIPRSIPWFPIVGLIIGVVLLPLGVMAGWLWGDLGRAAVLVVAWAVLTGGLHLDGLSDTFDGVWSWRPRERKLEIMQDSRIGAMGTLALIAVLLLKCVWLAGAGEQWWQAVLLAPLWGRWADSYGIHWFPPAREGGLGRTFQAELQPRHFIITTTVTLVCAVVIGGGVALLAGGLVWLVTWWLARWWTRDLGGLTGDTYGALCEIGEVVVLATCAAAVGLG
jgi:adenosylcobinamide-GDP ribazoletransferase